MRRIIIEVPDICEWAVCEHYHKGSGVNPDYCSVCDNDTIDDPNNPPCKEKEINQPR